MAKDAASLTRLDPSARATRPPFVFLPIIAIIGILGVLLYWLLSQWRAPLDFPIRFEVAPDARVFAFAFAVSLVSGLLFSIAPARQTLSADPSQALAQAARLQELLATGRYPRFAALITTGGPPATDLTAQFDPLLDRILDGLIQSADGVGASVEVTAASFGSARWPP